MNTDRVATGQYLTPDDLTHVVKSQPVQKKHIAQHKHKSMLALFTLRAMQTPTGTNCVDNSPSPDATRDFLGAAGVGDIKSGENVNYEFMVRGGATEGRVNFRFSIIMCFFKPFGLLSTKSNR